MTTRCTLRVVVILAVSLSVSSAVEWQDTVYVNPSDAGPCRTAMNNAWGVQSYDYDHSWFNPPAPEVVHAVYWYEPDLLEVAYARSTDGGASWGDRFQVSDGAPDEDEAYTPALVTYGSTYLAHDVHVVYYDDDEESESILRRRNTAEGDPEEWETPQDVSPSGWEGESFRPSATVCRVPGGTRYNMHVAWEDEEEYTATGIWWYRRDFEQGSDCEYTVNKDPISPDDGYEDRNPSIATVYRTGSPDENYIYVAWYDYSVSPHLDAEVWFMRSTNTGDDWCSPVNLSNTASYESEAPCVAAIDEHVYVVWQEEKSDGRYELRFKHSTNYGGSWGSSVCITEDLMEGLDHNEPPECFTPSIACYGDYVYVVCQAGWDYPDEWYTLGFLMSDDNGDNWYSEGIESGGTDDLPDLDEGDIGLFPSISVSKGPAASGHKYLNVIYSVFDATDQYQVCYLRGNNIDELPGGGGGGQGGWRTSKVSPALRAYPSVARGCAKLTVDLNQHDNVCLSIYNANGARVRRLGSGLLAAGTYDVCWDATDEMGRKVSAGTYLAVLESTAGVVSSRVQLIEE